jgi:hypothetical protein
MYACMCIVADVDHSITRFLERFEQGVFPQLISACEIAPFGKGLATVVDPAVRQCWQLDAARVVLSARWQRHVQALAHAACVELGLDPVALGVEARLYKVQGAA